MSESTQNAHGPDRTELEEYLEAVRASGGDVSGYESSDDESDASDESDHRKRGIRLRPTNN